MPRRKLGGESNDYALLLELPHALCDCRGGKLDLLGKRPQLRAAARLEGFQEFEVD